MPFSPSGCPGSYTTGTFPGAPVAPAFLDLEAGVEKVIAELLKSGVTEEEVARAKRQLQDGAILARDNLQTAPRLIGSALMSGRDVQEIEAWPDRIGEVTAAEVNEAARTLFRPEATVTSELRPKPTS